MSANSTASETESGRGAQQPTPTILIKEADVRELHGVMGKTLVGGNPASVKARENEQTIIVGIRGEELTLSTSAARRLASMLLRCARRVEARGQ